MVHDDLWCFVVVRDVSGCFVVICDGSWWFVMFRGGLWWFVVFRDDSWCFMVVRDVSCWFVMVRGGFSLQFSRKYHVTHYLTNQSPRFSIKSHFEWDFVMVRDVSWWFVVVRDDLWWFVMVRDVSWWFVVVRDGSWWFMVVRDDSWWFVMVHGGFSLQFSRKYHVTHYLTNQSPRFSIKSQKYKPNTIREVAAKFSISTSRLMDLRRGAAINREDTQHSKMLKAEKKEEAEGKTPTGRCSLTRGTKYPTTVHLQGVKRLPTKTKNSVLFGTTKYSQSE